MLSLDSTAVWKRDEKRPTGLNSWVLAHCPCQSFWIRTRTRRTKLSAPCLCGCTYYKAAAWCTREEWGQCSIGCLKLSDGWTDGESGRLWATRQRFWRNTWKRSRNHATWPLLKWAISNREFLFQHEKCTSMYAKYQCVRGKFRIITAVDIGELFPAYVRCIKPWGGSQWKLGFVHITVISVLIPEELIYTDTRTSKANS